jgi:hypothetical protein
LCRSAEPCLDRRHHLSVDGGRLALSRGRHRSVQPSSHRLLDERAYYADVSHRCITHGLVPRKSSLSKMKGSSNYCSAMGDAKRGQGQKGVTIPFSPKRSHHPKSHHGSCGDLSSCQEPLGATNSASSMAPYGESLFRGSRVEAWREIGATIGARFAVSFAEIRFRAATEKERLGCQANPLISAIRTSN